MLTDYHVHLRQDDLDASVEEHHTEANVERYLEVAGERGIAELGVSEHVYRFRQALEIWRHPFWEGYAHDDIDAYCAFVREHGGLRLGIEMDFVPGAEDRTANLLEARDFDYVIGSVHFVREGAVDMDLFSVWDSGRSVEQIWRRYFETIGESAASGLFDVIAHPDLVKYWGSDRPRPDGDLRRYYEIAVEGIAESGVAVEVSTAGLRKPVDELYPSPAFLEMCVEADVPVALSSDAHRAEDVGADYDRALELLEAAGVAELCVFEHRSRRLEPIGPAAGDRRGRAGAGGGGRGLSRAGIGFDSHRLVEGRRLLIGGVEIPSARGLQGHSDADVLAHAVIDALLGAAGLGDIGEHFPDSDERWRDADSIVLLEETVTMLGARGVAIANVDCTVVMQAPRLAPHRSAIRERLAAALGIAPERVNVKATTGEEMGFVGRGEGVAALAVAMLEPPG